MGMSSWFSRRPRRRRPLTTRQHVAFRPSLELLEDRTLLSASPTTAVLQPSYGQLPLAFTVNQGQAASSIDYLAQGGGYSVALSAAQAQLNLSQGPTTTTLNMQLLGANSSAQAVGQNELVTKSNYLMGSDPSKWLTDLANYGQVEYQNVYQGIDAVYSGKQGQVATSFLVHPGASAGVIQIHIQGAEGLSLDAKGNLVIQTSSGDITEQAPVMYQTINGRQQAVSGHYVLEGDNTVGFQVGTYDPTQTLVIDPTLSYSSYLPNPSYAIALNSAGDAYLTGVSSSGAFVSELNSTGTAMIYTTYLGSAGAYGIGIAVDSAGDAYVTGNAGTSSFPTTSNAAFPTTSASKNAFVSELNATGSGLIYSTYLPDAGVASYGRSGGIALDNAGNIYVTGGALAGFTTTANAFQRTSAAPSGTPNAFMAEIDPNLSGSASLVYSSFLGGSGTNGDWGTSVAVDGSGNVYIAGDASSTNFPTTAGAFQRTYASGGSGGFAVGDAFVSKFNPSLSGSASLVYSTYLGGGDGYVSDIGPNEVVLVDIGEKDGPAIAVDSSGNAYVAGTTNSSKFPTTRGAFQTTYHAGTPGNKKNPGTSNTADAFVTKLNPTGSALVYSTYLGGSSMDGAKAIAVDASGNAYVTGYTRSTDFPLVNPLQSQKASGNDSWGNPNSDVFVTTLNASGSALLFSTYLGGSSDDSGNGIAINSAGDAYVTGGSANPTSSNFPTTPGAYQTTAGNGFVFMIDPPVQQNTGQAASLANSSGETLEAGKSHFTSPHSQKLAGSNSAFRNDPLAVQSA